MSHEELSSVPNADTLSSGDESGSNHVDGVRPHGSPAGGAEPITHVPISIVKRMEQDLNATEAARRENAKRAMQLSLAIVIADEIIGSLKTHLPDCSELGTGPLLGLISAFHKAVRQARE